MNDRQLIADLLSALEYHTEQTRPIEFSLVAIEAAREYLRKPAQQQEPVAYSYTSRITGAQGFSHHPMPRFIDSESWDIQPLYTSPPASKPWVGLTDEEVDECYYWKGRQWTTDELVRHVEAKLREKNNG